jgi:hypothetical protein
MRLKGITEVDNDGIDYHEARARMLAGLKWYGGQKGFKPGYPAAKFKDIYGCWPNGESGVPSDSPSKGAVWYIKRSNAEYAKAMRLKEAAENAKLRVVAKDDDSLMSAEDWGGFR